MHILDKLLSLLEHLQPFLYTFLQFQEKIEHKIIFGEKLSNGELHFSMFGGSFREKCSSIMSFLKQRDKFQVIRVFSKQQLFFYCLCHEVSLQLHWAGTTLLRLAVPCHKTYKSYFKILLLRFASIEYLGTLSILSNLGRLYRNSGRGQGRVEVSFYKISHKFIEWKSIYH